jgi:serine protease Do
MIPKQAVLYIVATTFVSVLVLVMFAVALAYANREAVLAYLFEEYRGIPVEELTFPTEESRITQIVAEASPAVVSIVAFVTTPGVRQLGPFEIRLPGGGESQKIGSGTGFFISSSGLVLTNKHVVASDDVDYSVLLTDGRELDAEVVDRDPFNDLAVLKVSGRGYHALSFGDSSNLKPGQTVIAIGNALGEFSNSVSVGVVSGLSRSVLAGSRFSGETELLDEVIQTDAAINPGNSGGPLLDLSGNVIGVNVAIAQGSENISFALPSNLAQQVADSIEQYGEIIRPYLGVRYIDITETIARQEGLPVAQGAYVISGGDEPAVEPGSPADEAGLEEGDIITSMDGVEVSGVNGLSRIIRTKQVGDSVTLEILRNGEEILLETTLEKAPDTL